MRLKFRELPRAGTVLTGKDIITASQYTFNLDYTFATAFARWLPVKKVWLVTSGRAALCLILRAMAERSGKREVVIPAYTCPTVPLAVARAGLQVRLCDVDPATGNLDVRQLAGVVGDETLAIVPVHMHGIPCDMNVILAIAQQHGVSVIEDCASAAGASLDGRKVGTFGDAAFFSLGRGKGFTAYEGGIGVGEPGSSEAERLGSIGAEFLILIKLLAMAVFFHPRLYWSIRSLPLGWGNEVYGLDFAISGMGHFRQGVALSILKRLDKVVAKRREKARYLLDQLRESTNVRFLDPPIGSQPSYPWLPLLVEERDEVVGQLRAKGLGASWMFTNSLNQYDFLQGIVLPGSYPVAEHTAAHLLTLPTHQYVTQQDMDQMAAVLAEQAC